VRLSGWIQSRQPYGQQSMWDVHSRPQQADCLAHVCANHECHHKNHLWPLVNASQWSWYGKAWDIHQMHLQKPALKSPMHVAESVKNFHLWQFGSEKCYLRRRVVLKVLARRSKKCYYREGNCHFRAQKSAISGETFAGASQGLERRWLVVFGGVSNSDHSRSQFWFSL
jgi:hypothetical protein